MRSKVAKDSQIYLTASFVKVDVGQARLVKMSRSCPAARETVAHKSNDTRQTGKLLD